MSYRRSEKNNSIIEMTGSSLPSKKTLGKMGYLKDQEGILARYLRETENWKVHLENTKKFIISIIENYQPANIAVLGSGWMLDLPVDFLKTKCKKIFLFDIEHPKIVKYKYRHYDNFVFINDDITGGYVNYFYSLIENFKNGKDIVSIDKWPQFKFSLFNDADYIISLNILNQLDILIIDYLKKLKNFLPGELNKIRSLIQKQHIELLKPRKSCLITDFEELFYDRNNNFIEKRSLLYTKLPDGKRTQNWEWKFDTSMTYHENRKTFFNVTAMEI